MYVCMHVCIYVCVCIYVRMCARICDRAVYVCSPMFIGYVCTRICIYIFKKSMFTVFFKLVSLCINYIRD
jgi:hypothetical protein